MEPFGDELRPKKEVTTRISFLIIGEIPRVNTHLKSQKIRTFIRSNDVDILGMAETNVNWSNVRNQNGFYE